MVTNRGGPTLTFCIALVVGSASINGHSVNLFAVATLQLEFVPGGGFFKGYRFDGIRLLPYHSGFGLVVLICEILFVFITIYFTVREIIEMCTLKKKYCSSYWNYAEMLIILFSYMAIISYVFRYVTTEKLLARFNETKGNVYINLQYVYMLDQLFGGLLSFVVFIATIKFIKLLRFNKRMSILSSTLAHAWNELIVFGICFIIVFLAFSQLFYLLMSSSSVDFSTFMKTVEYTFSMMLSKFNFDEISSGNFLGPIAFFFFSLMTSIILVNLFLTIVISSFEDVSRNILKQSNEYEIVEFIVNRFAVFFGFGRPSGPPPRILPESGYVHERQEENDDVKELPKKVDQLCNYINQVYFDGKIDFNDEEKLKGMFGGKKRGVISS